MLYRFGSLGNSVSQMSSKVPFPNENCLSLDQARPQTQENFMKAKSLPSAERTEELNKFGLGV